MAEHGYVDGNAAAGALGDVFRADPTVTRGRCAGCGRVATLAQARVYDRGPGLVLRCAGCDAVLLRLVRLPDRTVVELRGLAHLELEHPS